MSSRTVKDRSPAGMLSKAERRALGKAAARKRAQQRRRRELRKKIAKWLAPVVVAGAVVGVIWLANRDAPTTNANASPGASPSGDIVWSLPEGMDPALATRPVITAGEGTLTELKVTTLIEGTGEELTVGSVVTANYLGAYYGTGETFTGGSSWTSETTTTPYGFVLGMGNVIKGWDQGLIGVKVGSRVQLDIPSALAYPNPQRGQPAGDLRFIVDVVAAS